MEIHFSKMHGTLNDFVVFHDAKHAVHLSPDQIQYMCNRRRGVGADGVIAVRSSTEADFFMDYANADGSLAEMCGNGIRCLGKFVYDKGLTTKTELAVETRAGVRNLELLLDETGLVDRVTVDMGTPTFRAEDIPVDLETDGGPILNHPITVQGTRFAASILSMGNPHCVILSDLSSLDTLPVQIGPLLECHPLFPAKTNVEFIHIRDAHHIVMRVWERGSGETLACGTGACASVVAARLLGAVESGCMVELRGGPLGVSWEGTGYSVFMTGSATTVFEGIITT